MFGIASQEIVQKSLKISQNQISIIIDFVLIFERFLGRRPINNNNSTIKQSTIQHENISLKLRQFFHQIPIA